MLHTYKVSGHFTVGDLTLIPGPEREERIKELERILHNGLSHCTTIDSYLIARQMRPWNDTRHDGLPEPDLIEEVIIRGTDPDAVFGTYRNDEGHARMVEELHALGWATWQTVVYQIN